MPNVAPSSSAPLSVAQTIHTACERHPALAPLIEHFSELYSIRAELIASLAEQLAKDTNCPVPVINEEKLQHGVPVLSDSNAAWAASCYPKLKETVFVHLKNISSLESSITLFEQAIDTQQISLESLFDALLNSNESVLQAQAKKADIEYAVFIFISQQMLSCLLSAYVHVHKETVQNIFWREAYCPVCGSFPDISILQRPDADQSEFLAGGGGKKMLHCSTCSHQWHFRRGTCPACNNDEAGAIHYFHVDGNTGERVEYCNSCNTYLNNIDLRNTTATPDLSVTPLTLIHLDMQAAQKQLTPLVRTLWNTF